MTPPNPTELNHFLAIASQAARQAGAYIKSKWETKVEIEYKGEINLVTEVDKTAEKMIIDVIRREFQTHDVLAEEGSPERKDSAYKWVIDPLDGTVNFAHGYPLFCVSIALEFAGEVIVGAVFEPLREELFTAVKGGGAFLNGRQIHVTAENTLIKSMISTGFSYNFKLSKDNSLEYFRNVIVKVQAVRRDGVAAIDLCYVACGRYDGFWELNLFPWDVAAGVLVVTEAGGRVTRFDGSPYSVYDKEILATNGGIHRELSAILCVK